MFISFIAINGDRIDGWKGWSSQKSTFGGDKKYRKEKVLFFSFSVLSSENQATRQV